LHYKVSCSASTPALLLRLIPPFQCSRLPVHGQPAAGWRRHYIAFTHLLRQHPPLRVLGLVAVLALVGWQDLWKLDLSTNKWEQLELKNGPTARSGHRMGEDPTHMLITAHCSLCCSISILHTSYFILSYSIFILHTPYSSTPYFSTSYSILHTAYFILHTAYSILRTPHPAPRTPHPAPPHPAPRTPHPAPHPARRTPHSALSTSALWASFQGAERPSFRGLKGPPFRG